MKSKNEFKLSSYILGNKTKNKPIYIILKLILGIILYFTAVAGQIYSSIISQSNVAAFLAQVQVMISAYLVLRVKKWGYITAVCLNLFSTIFVSIKVIFNHDYSIIPGIIVPITTCLTITIMHIVYTQLNKKISELDIQKKKLYKMNEKISSAQEELELQNEQLYNNYILLQENKEKLSKMAYFDTLTDLPNRKMIIDRLDKLTNTTNDDEKQFSVIFIDLDNFKKINDTMGHHAGDELLIMVTKKLMEIVHPNDLLGRLGGDEFALIVQRALKKYELSEYAELLRSALTDQFVIDNTMINISASFGLAFYPKDGKTSTELLKCADTAMYKAKDLKNACAFFDEDMKNKVLKKINFESRILSAIANEEFYLMYQPQYIFKSKKIRGFDILLRWNSPDGLIMPADFLPEAEESRLIIKIGEWILKTVCLNLKSINKQNNDKPIISINISRTELMDSGFVDMVRRTLDKTGVSGSNLEFKLNETIFTSYSESIHEVLLKIKEMGILISLDAVKTVYTSLNSLKQIPADTFKISKSFIYEINKGKVDTNIVSFIINLIDSLQLSLITEGIEEETQLECFNNHECNCLQQYILGEPIKGNDFINTFKEA